MFSAAGSTAGDDTSSMLCAEQLMHDTCSMLCAGPSDTSAAGADGDCDKPADVQPVAMGGGGLHNRGGSAHALHRSLHADSAGVAVGWAVLWRRLVCSSHRAGPSKP